MGLLWLQDWSLCVLWLQMMLWSPVNWTKPLPTPFCFLVTNSHCKKVSTCVMAKAKAVPKCFSCKILECCLQCQWVSVKSFGVGSLSSFCRIRWGNLVSEAMDKLQVLLLFYLPCQRYKVQILSFQGTCVKGSQIFIHQEKRTRSIFFPNFNVTEVLPRWWERWWNLQSAS